MASFTIRQGETLAVTFTVRDAAGVPAVLTLPSARMQVRTYVGGPLILQATTEGSGLTMRAALGEIDLDVPATLTAQITSGGVFDVEVFDPGDPASVQRVVEGAVEFSPEVTGVLL